MATFDPSSREREAHAEIAATRWTPRTAWALIAAALALGASGIGLEVAALARGGSSLTAPLALPRAASPWPPLAWNQRTVALLREVDRRVEQGSALAHAIRPWGQLALTRLLRYGNEEAYLGRRGWLVYRPDFDHLTGHGYLTGDRDADPIGAIDDFAADLARRQIALLVLLAPAKPSVHCATLPREDLGEAPRNPSDGALAERLRGSGVTLLDPTELLRREGREAPAYLATDTHWRPEAMDAVARETAIRLRAMVELPVGDESASREEVVAVRGMGDTAALLRLPLGVRPFPLESVECRRVLRADGTPWRAQRGAPVLLLGDSFSAVYSLPELGFGAGAGLAERLSFHLALPVDRILRNAGGASATREALASELLQDPTRLDGVRVVVWQLAARELSQGDWRGVSLPLAEGDR